MKIIPFHEQRVATRDEQKRSLGDVKVVSSYLTGVCMHIKDNCATHTHTNRSLHKSGPEDKPIYVHGYFNPHRTAPMDDG
jgi:hypothetical protein